MDTRWQSILQNLPDQRLARCWDLEQHRLRPERLDAYLGVASTGERHLAQFLASVWCGPRDHRCQPGGPWHFDFIMAMGTLEGSFRRVVFEWLERPYFP